MRRLIIRADAYYLSIGFRISDTEEFVRVKDHLKHLTFARWDGDEKIWIVPISMLPCVKEWALQHFLTEEITYVPAPPKAKAPPVMPRPGSSLQHAYSALHVAPDAPNEVIVAAYRALGKLHHPDTGHGDHALMATINAAMDEIKKVRT